MKRHQFSIRESLCARKVYAREKFENSSSAKVYAREMYNLLIRESIWARKFLSRKFLRAKVSSLKEKKDLVL